MLYRLTFLLLLISFFGQAWFAAEKDSVTIDEYAHLPVGVYMRQTQDFAIDSINPPLARLLFGLTVDYDGPALTPDMYQWGMGTVFEHYYGFNYQNIFLRARLVTIFLGLLLGLLVFCWSFELYGKNAALTALTIYTFTPSILAHTHLVTLDLPGALAITACMYATYRFFLKPTSFLASLLGLAVGIALLTKFTALIVPFVIEILFVAAVCRRTISLRSASLYSLLIFFSALVVLNSGYFFEGTFSPIGGIAFTQGGLFNRVAFNFPSALLPFPKPFLTGLDLLLHEGDHIGNFYLLGSFSNKAWWYYHILTFLLKAPIPIIGGSIFSCLLWRNRSWKEAALIVPVLTIFLANALGNSQAIGERHILPVYPLLTILMSPLFLTIIGRVGLAWIIASTLFVTPRYLQYFNEFAGGPENGHRYFIDSNIDWGQDLLRLKEYMQDHSIETVNLAYFGRVDPVVYKIRFRPLEDHLSGIAVISASFLMGKSYFWYSHGSFTLIPANYYAWLRKETPIARVGSMFVFDVKNVNTETLPSSKRD